MRRRLTALTALALLVAAVAAFAAAAGNNDKGAKELAKVNHLVVIYEENHSFDNLYGGWEGVNGLAAADEQHTTQLSQAGSPFSCLLQNDVNLVATTGGTCVLPNTWFTIDTYIPASAKTCPPPGAFYANGIPEGTGGALAGGCTRDIVHRFYNEQFQIDGGAQDRYVLGSDAAGLAMGVYDTRALPIYQYLHSGGHPHYAILDSFFQGAFGGSFLNHQWLIAAAAPQYNGTVPTGPTGLRTVLDRNGMPTGTPLYTPVLQPGDPAVLDKAVTASCPLPYGLHLACGDYAVNTIQPFYAPHSGGATLPPLTNTTIGDELSNANVSWAWYSGGWNDAEAGHPDPLFQYHHQPFNYFQKYATGTAARAEHLRDEQEFIQATQSSADTCNLRSVSFVKPLGEENEHPGYTSEIRGSNHLVDLLRAIEGSACAKDTMVVVTYDEFGGQWDHVPPPGQAGGPAGPSDKWGPGTRIPALVIAPGLRGNFVVDSAEHDTTSIIATIERRWSLPTFSPTARDKNVDDLSTVFDAHQVEASGSTGG
jgi:acid phosphatase